MAGNSPKKGMQGGFAACRASRYSPKFLVLAINVLMFSRVPCTRAGTWSQVLLSRAMGAVPSADMMDVKVEKLFNDRHFCALG